MEPSLGENPDTVKTTDTLNSDPLDATPTQLDAVPATSGMPGAATSSEASVLVVDDSRFVRASLVRGLKGRFRIQQAESGERAWELLLLDGSIGAILSDLSMPGIDGFELLQRIRGSLVERVRDLPFVMLSGSDDTAQRDRALALGADRFVVKGDGVGALADWIDVRLRADQDVADRVRGLTDPLAGQLVSTAPVMSSATAVGKPSLTIRPAATPVRPMAACVPSTVAPRVPATPVSSDAPASVIRLEPDPVPRWFAAVEGRVMAGGEVPPSMIRLHAPGLDDVPARLRRGVRAADALFIESGDTAWLCVPASAATALRLALRFGLLAGGRQAHATDGATARVSVCMHPVDPLRPGDALAALLSAPPELHSAGGLSIRAFPGAWGPAWQCTLPWPMVRLQVAG